MRIKYDLHLPALSLQDWENSQIILVGPVLPTVQHHFLCKNWHLCRMFWENCERKKLHVPTYPDVV